MTPSRAAVALLVVFAVVALAFSSAPTAGAQPAAPLAAVQALLDQRAAAVRDGNSSAFLATVDPRATPRFVAAQRRSFSGMRSVPLEGYRLEARTEDTGDLAVGLGLARRYGAPAFLPETRQTYRLRGYEDHDTLDSLFLTYVRRGAGWYVASDTDTRAIGLDTTRNLWDLGPVRVRATRHYLLLSRPAQAKRADALASIAEDAAAVLDERWTRPWSRRIPLILPGSVQELETILQTTFDLDNFVAFVAYGTNRDRDWEAGPPRIYIQDRNLSAYSRRFQIETLVHELVHAATAPFGGPFVPAWVHEGLADWTSKARSTRERAPKASDGKLPRDHEFTTGGGRSIVTAYGESRSAMSVLARLRGLDAPPAVFEAIGKQKASPGSIDHVVSTALRSVAGFDLAGFEQRWSGRK